MAPSLLTTTSLGPPKRLPSQRSARIVRLPSSSIRISERPAKVARISRPWRSMVRPSAPIWLNSSNPWIVAGEAVVLEAAPAPWLRPGVADLLLIDRCLAVGGELPHHIARNVGEQQVALIALLHPHRAFREAEPALDEFHLGVGRDDRIERRIEPQHRRVRLLGNRQGGAQHARRKRDRKSHHLCPPGIEAYHKRGRLPAFSEACFSMPQTYARAAPVKSGTASSGPYHHPVIPLTPR